MTDPHRWLLLLAALHAGFQWTVTGLVYPALADGPEDTWSQAHAAHSRRITPLVALVYLPLLGVLGWALVAEPVGTAVLVAAGGVGLSFVTTAAVAAPLHGRLSAGRSEDLVRRLLVADRVRAVGAVVGLVGAVLAA